MTTTERCAVGKALDALEGADREDLQAILDNSVASIIISTWLTNVRKFRGCTVTVVNKHRKGEGCGCS